MKKFLVVLALFFVCTGNLYASIVPLKKAKRMALSYFTALSNKYSDNHSFQYIISDVYAEKDKSKPLFYIFSFEPEGYVIISAEDATIPLLGFSFEGKYLDQPSFRERFPVIRYYREQIREIRENQTVPSRETR